MTDALAVADKFFRAIESGDLKAVDALYAEDVAVWHNTDGIAQNKADNLRVLAWMITAIPLRRYRILRRNEIPGGFVQQHVLELTRGSASYAMPACIIAQVRGGQIGRIDEYLDTAHVGAMRAALSL